MREKSMRSDAGEGLRATWRRRGVVGLAGLVGLAAVLLLSGFLYERWAGMRSAAAFPPPGHRVEIGGLRLHLDCEGKGSPTVVVEAGAGSWSLAWKGIQRRLSKVTRTCLYDRAGYGWSAEGPMPRTGDRLAGELGRLLETSDEPPPYLLVGHSLGGWIVRLYRDAHPERVAGIALVESAHEEQWARLPIEVKAFLDAGVDRLETGALLAPFGLTRLLSRGRSLASHDLGPRLRPVQEAQLRRPSWFSTLASESGNAEATAARVAETGDLGDLPLLVLSAGRSFDAFEGPENDIPYREADRIWLELQRELAGLSTRARHRIGPESSHVLQLDDPELVAGELASFVRGIRFGTWPREVGDWSADALTALPRASVPAVDRFLESLEAAYASMDVEAFTSHYSEDFVQLDPNRRVRVEGGEAWEAQTRRVNAAHRAMGRRHLGRLWAAPWLVVELEWWGTVKGAALGTPGEDREYRYAGLGLLKIEEGVIRRQILWGDFATLQEQLGIGR